MGLKKINFYGFSHNFCLLKLLRISATVYFWSTNFFILAMMSSRYTVVSFPILASSMLWMKCWKYSGVPVSPNGIVRGPNSPLSPLATLKIFIHVEDAQFVYLAVSKRISVSSIFSGSDYLFYTVIIFSS